MYRSAITSELLLRELRNGIKVQPDFFRARRIKGKVEKVWSNQTLKGKRYSVLQIDVEWYSLWNDAYFGRIKTGQANVRKQWRRQLLKVRKSVTLRFLYYQRFVEIPIR